MTLPCAGSTQALQHVNAWLCSLRARLQLSLSLSLSLSLLLSRGEPLQLKFCYFIYSYKVIKNMDWRHL